MLYGLSVNLADVMWFILLNSLLICVLCTFYSPDGTYVGVGMLSGSVAVYIAFSLQVRHYSPAKTEQYMY